MNWVEILERYPLKYKFDGLDGERGSRGFYENAGDAAAADERFMEEWMAGEARSAAEYLGECLADLDTYADEWLVEGYIRMLRDEKCWDEDEMTDEEVLEKYNDESERLDFVSRNQGYDDCQFQWDYLRSDDAQPYLLEKHPPVEVWAEEYGSGIEVDHVLFCCPTCTNPVSDERTDAWVHYFYCGVCGTGTYIGDDYLCMVDWCEAMGAELYPYAPVKREKLLAQFSRLEKLYEAYCDKHGAEVETIAPFDVFAKGVK